MQELQNVFVFSLCHIRVQALPRHACNALTTSYGSRIYYAYIRHVAMDRTVLVVQTLNAKVDLPFDNC